MSDWLTQLRCPNDGSQIRVANESELTCSECHHTYSIVDGIPRFVESQHLASFGFQWNRYDVAHTDEDRATFEAKTGFRLAEMSGLKVLDAGCGGGRYCKIVAETGANVYGADHSNAVDKAKQLCTSQANVRFVQADLKALPFAEESFDAVFSIGVMHHDANTLAVFNAVAKMVKPGGRLAVWLYRRNQWWQEWINNRLRHRSTKLDNKRIERWARFGATLGGIPVLNRTLNKLVNFSNHPVRENRICDTYDWYAPAYQHHHTVEELTDWFQAAGFEDLRILPPEKNGRFYDWCYRNNLIIGSGVNVQGTRTQ